MTFSTDGNMGVVILLTQYNFKTPIDATCMSISIVYGDCKTAWNTLVVCAVRLFAMISK